MCSLFSPTTHLQSQKLLTGFNVPLYLARHRLNDFNTVFIEHIEHVSDAETWRGSRNSLVAPKIADEAAE